MKFFPILKKMDPSKSKTGHFREKGYKRRNVGNFNTKSFYFYKSHIFKSEPAQKSHWNPDLLMFKIT